MISSSMLLLIILCALVTWIPRVIPFIIVKRTPLPQVVMTFLSYIPICILSALVFESIFEKGTTFATINIENACVLLPTVIIAIWTKSLSITVLSGVAIMALVRTLFSF